MKWLKPVASAVLAGAVGVMLWVAYPSQPELVYDTVAGYPMLVYYHNTGAPAQVTGFGGVPAVSLGEPLPPDKIDALAAEARKHVQPAADLVKTGDRTRFMLDDPDGLAWVQGTEDHPAYFYIIAIVESPRSSIALERKWVNEICLVAKTGERFKRCPTHNRVYSDS